MNRSALPDAVPALFPAAAERERIGTWLNGQLAGAMARAQAGPVTPTVDMDAFLRELSAFDFETPQPLESALNWTIERLQVGMVQMSNPRYFGLFNPGANFPSQCADQIVALFNPQLASSGSSPVPVAMENHVLRAVAKRAGFPANATGHFATGGSESNFTALIAALTAAHAGFASQGLLAFGARVAFYTSQDCHIAWQKIAHQAGIGRSALRRVATDGAGRMDPQALSQAIALDRAAGTVPIMVVATAGTTGAGMIDPLHACADIAEREQLWYHVDAAWGGGALASERLRVHLDGLERADSFTVDAHKWLAATMGCALFITRRGAVLSDAFRATTDFMPSSVLSVDPYLNSVQWSRRFLGLRLFLALASAGWQGLGAHVERGALVIERVRNGLEASGWSIANDSPLAVLNAIPPRRLGDVRSLVKRVVASGRAWAAATTFEGRDVVRICATNGETVERDIAALLAALNEGAQPQH